MINLENMGPFLTVMVGLIVIFGCVGLLLRVANDAKAVFGRRPPLDNEVRKIEARVARLEVVMERLATKEALTQLERISGRHWTRSSRRWMRDEAGRRGTA